MREDETLKEKQKRYREKSKRASIEKRDQEQRKMAEYREAEKDKQVEYWKTILGWEHPTGRRKAMIVMGIVGGPCQRCSSIWHSKKQHGKTKASLRSQLESWLQDKDGT